MWSPFYWYYEIRGNETYSQRLLTNDVLEVLENTGKLQRRGNQQFCNIDDFPWIDIVVVNSDNGNYGSLEDLNSEWVNLIAIAGSKSNPGNEILYINLLTEIAQKINWELISEADDDGNENIVLVGNH
ncbi:hypothetical protein SAMN04488122_5367 [Chitinophaga arvensicola]|uniref:Uncharacterized protein n=2 Tax=Chitinophaga arvensicola TaxID=29529 RepID=A0A1I0SAA4_9BACT|nr:hypothetical protein SAMN04488122_5367 [Chitinophaga arvensicola]